MSSKGFKFQNDLFLIHNCRLSYTQCGPMTCIHWWTDAEIRLVQNVTVTENDERKSDKNYLWIWVKVQIVDLNKILCIKQVGALN